MSNFNQEQVEKMINLYKQGKSLREIGECFNVCRETIKKIIQSNYNGYSCKKRISIPSENQTKKCTKCGKELPLDKFNRGNSLYGRRSYCRECEHLTVNTDEKRKRRREIRDFRRKTEKDYVLKERAKNKNTLLNNYDSYKKYMVRSCKQRAKVQNLPFSITYKDFEIPEYCPLLNIKLQHHIGESFKRENSPSIDRIIPHLGYVPNNIWVISARANKIKNDASLEELQTITTNLEIKLKSLK